MALGPGKYDDLCTYARITAGAEGAILIILNGVAGSGFSCQLPLTGQLAIAGILRTIADEIEQDCRGKVH